MRCTWHCGSTRCASRTHIQLNHKSLTFASRNAALPLHQQQEQLSVPELLGRDSAQHAGERSAGALACLRGTSSSTAAMTDSAERGSSSNSSSCVRTTAAMTDSAEHNNSSSGSAGESHSSAAHVTRPKVTPTLNNCQVKCLIHVLLCSVCTCC
jgi:hypothetical protein